MTRVFVNGVEVDQLHISTSAVEPVPSPPPTPAPPPPTPAPPPPSSMPAFLQTPFGQWIDSLMHNLPDGPRMVYSLNMVPPAMYWMQRHRNEFDEFYFRKAPDGTVRSDDEMHNEVGRWAADGQRVPMIYPPQPWPTEGVDV